MKLKNNRTGEIVYLEGEITYDDKVRLLKHYNSLAELCKEWSDYEEPKEFWHISCEGKVNRVPYSEYCYYQEKEIGNYFETKEEAEKAVEKLKAWKRLKDNGFKFSGFVYTALSNFAGVNIKATMINDSINDDLELLFGDEEWASQDL